MRQPYKVALAARVLCWSVLCWSTGQAVAQERPFYFTSPIDLQTGWESGVPNGNMRLNVPATILTLPTFSLLHDSPRNQFTLSYDPQFEMFTSPHRLDSFNQNGTLQWVSDLSPRWSLSVNDVFTGTRDEGQRFETTFLLPLGQYNENGLYTSLNYKFTDRTYVKFRYENAFVDYNAINLSRPLFFSRMGNTGGLTVDHHFTSRLKVSGSYSYLRTTAFDKYDDMGNLILPFAPTQFTVGTVSYNATPSLLFEVTGGYVHNPANSYLVGGLVEKHLQHMTVAGGYNRYLTFVGAPSALGVELPVNDIAGRALPPNSISNTVSFRASGMISDHWGVEMNVLASRTAGETDFTTLRSAMGGVRLNYRISDHLTAFVNADLYRQNANVILPIPISRSRFFAGIAYTFSPSPDEIARRREAARSGLKPETK